MIKSQRVQLLRKKGFNLQEESRKINGLPAIKCDRSSKEWGNPYKIICEKDSVLILNERMDADNFYKKVVVYRAPIEYKEEAIKKSIEFYKQMIKDNDEEIEKVKQEYLEAEAEDPCYEHPWKEMELREAEREINTEKIKEQLKGYNLACWCPLGQICHCDVLLEIINREEK
ncbi:MAG: DUF4326 domain-containing protein [Rickettsiales bacterium]|jgi:hypothetical protein|nr:DUF4326 domain-containing protein [Rickettsiales bacterium]